MTNIVPQSSSGGNAPSFDPSQFKLQPDGTFRISIRGMASMAGVDDNGLGRSLKSAADENPLPCARSIVAQGFDPADVASWSATGGIPEDAAPFILEHYGITAAAPSQQARAVLLAFTRVGINAYLKERLGVFQVRDTQPRLSEAQSSLEWLMGWQQRWGVKLDERDMLQIKQHAMSLALPPAGGAQQVFNDAPISRLVLELFGVVLESWQLIRIGKKVAARYRTQFKADPPKHDQYVDGANRAVAHYDRSWAEDQLRVLHAEDPTLFQRQK
jgi:hypothetical protein